VGFKGFRVAALNAWSLWECNIVSHGQARLISKLEKGQSYVISTGCETVNA
jgi:hypothetical protein